MTAPWHLLDAFPLIRSRSLQEANERIGQVFSPHRLELRHQDGQLSVTHNRVCLRDISLNVLHYGTEVVIDPGERGDFYLLQLPLSGSAQLTCDGQEVQAGADILSVLQPLAHSRMVWSSDCTMLLIHVPRSVIDARMGSSSHSTLRCDLAYSRHSPEVAAWWQAALDITHNIDNFGNQWLRHPNACAGMEEFLLSAFTTLLCAADTGPVGNSHGQIHYLRRAKDYIHTHIDRALTLHDIALQVGVSARTLEAIFQRYDTLSPLAYARRCRLHAVHECLQAAQCQGQTLHITQVALAHGFLHMGRFAAQYRAQFGCSPSQTLGKNTHHEPSPLQH